MEPHARTLPGLRPITWGGPGAREKRQGRRCQCHQQCLGVPGGGEAAAAAAAAVAAAASPHQALPLVRGRRRRPAAALPCARLCLPAPLLHSHSHSRGARQTQSRAQPTLLRRRLRHRARLRLLPFLLPAPASSAPAASTSLRSQPLAPRPDVEALGAHWLSCASLTARQRPPRSSRLPLLLAVPAPSSVFSQLPVLWACLLRCPVPAQVSLLLAGRD